MPVRPITIGDVGVCYGRPPGDNPYAADRVLGDERVAALLAFKFQTETLPSVKRHPDTRAQEIRAFSHRRRDEYTFWLMPSSGGAREISDPSEVDWSRATIDLYRWPEQS